MQLEQRAAEALAALYETAPDGLLDQIDAVLDALEKDPGQAWLRRTRFQKPPAWLVPARLASWDYVILWQLDDGEPIVRYIGPAF